MPQPPVREIAFTLRTIAGLDAAMAEGLFPDLAPDLVDAVLDEAAKFAAERMAPLDAIGDQVGANFENGAVTMPEGWRELYRDWTAGGWNAIAGPADYGGQELGTALAAAVAEMWNFASMPFALGPLLTAGAVEALDKHGSEGLKRIYLEKLVSGTWAGTMNLTEPQAGSDLAALRSRAERRDDGSYRIFGQKIYITYGEHDLTENIIHLVLARLPDAPAGVKGISLFLVPKFLPDEAGAPGRRNDVFCHSIEHKLGIHASPTCTMLFGEGTVDGAEPGAIGWLVGEENRGLACMFTMMNNARLMVGMEGVGLADAAYGKALAYAAERRQGRATRLAPGAEPAGGMSPILGHPDVARMLLTMKGLTEASRAIAFSCAVAIDRARAYGASDPDKAKAWQERANLLTPIAKAFSTDAACEVASLGIQVHGGMGFVEETGAARLLRNARITPIYEGTNGIQAIDLVTRKIGQSGGEAVSAFIGELEAIVTELTGRNAPDFGETAVCLAAATADLTAATDFLLELLRSGETDTALAGAAPYLKLFGLAAGGALIAKGALAEADPERVALCRFVAENLVPETAALRRTVRFGAASLAAAHDLLAAKAQS
ncbi:acyl-CoA dehydrogenase [Jiella sp. MQZ9-1]|uniref:3-methylmercaptopropionyl-CoA dehydrogenase n=1 Tax=Jiella flava TaxID=2816857 RepID=A0A939FXE8_9HYPH|nr:acyl-CoA dehydrogenase [Jiella flava]MBO0661277.1 acyl-CoA dehydrogenase [Jiella flava]MCD2469922.1 acyl-CoA dehydrogenase [Jiella flava]